MGEKIINELIDSLNGVCDRFTDTRRRGYDHKYEREDAIRCGFSLFFFESLSVLDFQRKMKEQKKRDNLETLFGVKAIPSDNELRALLDPIEQGRFAPAFRRNLEIASWSGMLSHYETIDRELLVGVDGTGYFSSKKIHCEHCQHKKQKEGEKEEELYYHTAVCGVVVKPGSNIVIPLMPEFITNVDGTKKQDCERNAGKRLIERYAKDYAGTKLVLLGDDLYANYPFCTDVLSHGMSFIFTCKPASHPWLTEVIANSYPHIKKVTRWNPHKKSHEIDTYTWLNEAPIRDDSDGKKSLLMNYFSLETTNKESGERIFYNSWVTDKAVTNNNIITYVEYARARWKIENENNNVLKDQGYNLEHNYGHGKEHLSEVFFLLNILAFMVHSILDFTSVLWQKARKVAGRRDTFFVYLNAYLRIQIFETWESLLHFVCQDVPSP
jgi:hypothetical protein